MHALEIREPNHHQLEPIVPYLDDEMSCRKKKEEKSAAKNTSGSLY